MGTLEPGLLWVGNCVVLGPQAFPDYSGVFLPPL